MRGMEIVERLMHFNLTRQEATLYLLLVKAGRLTGYEAAKQTGISRSNTYTALAGDWTITKLSCMSGVFSEKRKPKCKTQVSQGWVFRVFT